MATQGVGFACETKCRSVPTAKQTGQESGSELCEVFQILIVSAVKICKQCLRTASASVARSITGASSLDSTQRLLFSIPLGL